MIRSVQIAVAAVLLASCTGPGDIVRKRAAVERQCPEQSIRISELPGGAYRADGCGRSETFVCVVDQGSTKACTKDPGGTTIADAGVSTVP